MQKDKKDITIREKVNIALEKELFKKDTISFFVLKKAERLAAALYLVTDLFPAEDSLKWVLREKGTVLLSDMVEWCGHVPQVSDRATIVRDRIIELVSLLRVAAAAGYLSEMNRDVLIKEYYATLQFMMENEARVISNGKRIGEDFFRSSAEHLEGQMGRTQGSYTAATQRVGTKTYKGQHGNDIGHSVSDSERRGEEGSEIQGHESVSQRQIDTIRRHTNRRATIMELVQRKGSVSIKDISRVISGCGGKTIQRELMALVTEGVLKREGERRWSTYELA